MTGVLLAKCAHVTKVVSAKYVPSKSELPAVVLIWLARRFGVVTAVRLVHKANKLVPTLVTVLGMVIEVSEVHKANTAGPSVVMVLGIVILVRAEQPKNVESGSIDTPLPTVTEVSAEHTSAHASDSVRNNDRG